MKNGDFAIFYIKEGQLYPVAISDEQNTMLQMMIPATLGNKIQVLDKPQGELVELKRNKKKSLLI
jgi:hypothetical protein